VHHLIFPIVFVPFWTGSFLIFGKEEGNSFPGPSHSPDLTLLASYSGEFVKGIVYIEKVQNMNELHGKIIRAAECITSEMLANTNVLDVWCATYGAHIEIY
jgi:hypothetical protein